MPAHEGGAARTGGRRTQTSNGGNRGRCGEVAMPLAAAPYRASGLVLELLSDASEPDQRKTVAPVPATRGKADVPPRWWSLLTLTHR